MNALGGMQKIALEYNVKRLTQQIIDKAEKVLLAEVNTYDLYLRGDVYYYMLLDENDAVEDSCGGYFGDEGIEQIKNEFCVK